MAETSLSPEAVLRDGPEGPRLVGRRCATCETPQFPPQERCSACGSADVDELLFDRVATLETYSIVHVAPPGFESPYPVGFVRLSPGNRRTFGPLRMPSDRDTLAVGRDVSPTALIPDRDGVPESMLGFELAGGDR